MSVLRYTYFGSVSHHDKSVLVILVNGKMLVHFSESQPNISRGGLQSTVNQKCTSTTGAYEPAHRILRQERGGHTVTFVNVNFHKD